MFLPTCPGIRGPHRVHPSPTSWWCQEGDPCARAQHSHDLQSHPWWQHLLSSASAPTTLLWTWPHPNMTLLSLFHQEPIVCRLGVIRAEKCAWMTNPFLQTILSARTRESPGRAALSHGTRQARTRLDMVSILGDGQEEGEGKVKCPGIKGSVQEEQGSLCALPLPSKDPSWAKVYKLIITLHL